jgi:hypothetical protein
LRLGTFYSWEVSGFKRLKAGTFCDLGRFGVGMFWGWGILGLVTFWNWDILRLGPYVLRGFVFGTFLGWDVLSWTFVGALY